MHESLVVHILQSTQNWRQHPARFLCRQRPLRQNLRKIFLRVLLHDIKQRPAIQFAVSRLKNTNQTQIAQFASRLPSQQLLLGVRRVGGNQLDGGLLGIAGTPLCDEHGTVIGTTQITL